MANCVVTSPPFFGKRRYGTSKHELGQEENVDDYLSNIIAGFDAIQIHPLGSVWVNMGDTRGREGLLLAPERFVISMVERGWHLVDDVIWAKTVVQIDGSTTGHCMVEPTVNHNRLNGNASDQLYRFTRCLPGERLNEMNMITRS